MKFWAMALRVNDDGSRPSMRVCLDGASIHATREACLAEAAGVFRADEWMPVQVDVRMLTKLTPPPSDEGGTP